MPLTVEEFVTRYPAPPPIPRGERRHVISVSVNEAEYEAITRLANHPGARSQYDGALSAVVRHALHNYLWYMVDLIDDNFRAIGDRLHDELEISNYVQSEKQIVELLDNKAKRFNLLLNHDEVFSALEEYDKFLDFTVSLGNAWEGIVSKYVAKHVEMQEFRERMQRLGEDEMMALRIVEEKPR